LPRLLGGIHLTPPPHTPFMVTTRLLLWRVHGSFAHAQETSLQEFDYYGHLELSDWRVPGLAIAILKTDAAVLAKGYGVRRVMTPSTPLSGGD